MLNCFQARSPNNVILFNFLQKAGFENEAMSNDEMVIPKGYVPYEEEGMKNPYDSRL